MNARYKLRKLCAHCFKRRCSKERRNDRYEDTGLPAALLLCDDCVDLNEVFRVRDWGMEPIEKVAHDMALDKARAR